MGDRLAYFKKLKLADFLQGPEELEVEYEPPTFVRSGWAEAPGVVEKAPGGVFRYHLRATLRRGQDGAETDRAYMGRKLAFASNLRNELSFGTGYTVLGELSIIEDDATDATTTDGEVAAGNDQTMTLDADLSLGIGDYVLLVSGSAHEIVTVENVPTTLTFEGDFANTWADASTIYRLLYYAPQASAQSVPKITGLQPGTNNASINLDFTFASAADPVDNL
jgi:hypothetical protein